VDIQNGVDLGKTKTDRLVIGKSNRLSRQKRTKKRQNLKTVAPQFFKGAEGVTLCRKCFRHKKRRKIEKSVTECNKN
jgi:hypothetical protein